MLYIGGKFQKSGSDKVIKVINPATEQVIAQVPEANEADVSLAVKKAREAFESGPWHGTTGAQRAVFLRAIAAQVTAKKPELAKLETRDCGKPLKESEWDMDDVAGCFDYFAAQAEALDKRQGEKVDLGEGNPNFRCELHYQASGVVAAIIPWNYPLLMFAWKVAPALAAGCTVVVKPSELTPLTALEMGKVFDAVKLPPGVVNIITGAGATGAALVRHPGVDKVAFTGSVPTGVRVGTEAMKDVKNVTLELGGKSAIIVFDDVDIIKAVEWVMFGCFWTNGQICSATSRLLVHQKIADKFLSALAKACEGIYIGDPSLPENAEKTGTLGPVVSAGQHRRVMGYIQQAVKEGATVVTGGKKPANLKTGYFVQPTVLKVTPKMTIWKEEVFGPVLSVVSFSTEEEAVKLANDSDFGLAGAVISNDEARCKRVGKALRCGIMWINCSQPAFVQAPWGGLKKSGVGRELGAKGIENYLEPKQITSYVSKDAFGWYKHLPSKL